MISSTRLHCRYAPVLKTFLAIALAGCATDLERLRTHSWECDYGANLKACLTVEQLCKKTIDNDVKTKACGLAGYYYKAQGDKETAERRFEEMCSKKVGCGNLKEFAFEMLSHNETRALGDKAARFLCSDQSDYPGQTIICDEVGDTYGQGYGLVFRDRWDPKYPFGRRETVNYRLAGGHDYKTAASFYEYGCDHAKGGNSDATSARRSSCEWLAKNYSEDAKSLEYMNLPLDVRMKAVHYAQRAATVDEHYQRDKAREREREARAAEAQQRQEELDREERQYNAQMMVGLGQAIIRGAHAAQATQQQLERPIGESPSRNQPSSSSSSSPSNPPIGVLHHAPQKMESTVTVAGRSGWQYGGDENARELAKGDCRNNAYKACIDVNGSLEEQSFVFKLPLCLHQSRPGANDGSASGPNAQTSCSLECVAQCRLPDR